MNATKSPLHQQLLTLLLQREAELHAALETENARVLKAATGDVEVTDFKEIAAQGVAGAVEDMQMAHVADELANVMAAQRRLADGTYGYCAACGESIAEQRLLAIPQTPYCTACQAMHERFTDKPRSATLRT